MSAINEIITPDVQHDAPGLDPNAADIVHAAIFHPNWWREWEPYRNLRFLPDEHVEGPYIDSSTNLSFAGTTRTPTRAFMANRGITDLPMPEGDYLLHLALGPHRESEAMRLTVRVHETGLSVKEATFNIGAAPADAPPGVHQWHRLALRFSIVPGSAEAFKIEIIGSLSRRHAFYLFEPRITLDVRKVDQALDEEKRRVGLRLNSLNNKDGELAEEDKALGGRIDKEVERTNKLVGDAQTLDDRTLKLEQNQTKGIDDLKKELGDKDDALDNDIADLRAKNEDQDTEIGKAKETADKAESAVERLKEESDNADERHKMQLDRFEKQIRALGKSDEDFQELIDGINDAEAMDDKQVGKILGMVREVRNKDKSQDTAIDGLKKEDERIERRIGPIDDRARDAQDSARGAATDLEVLKGQFDRHGHEEINKRIRTVSDSVVNVQFDLTKLADETVTPDQLETTETNLGKRTDALAKRVTDLDFALTELSDTVGTFDSRIKALEGN